jgi:hypothetical protein
MKLRELITLLENKDRIEQDMDFVFKLKLSKKEIPGFRGNGFFTTKSLEELEIEYEELTKKYLELLETEL